MPLFQVIVIFDKEPVKNGVLAQDFFDNDQAPIVIQPVANHFHECVSIKRTNKLESQDHEHHRCVLNANALVQIAADQLVAPLEAAICQLLPAALKHL